MHKHKQNPKSIQLSLSALREDCDNVETVLSASATKILRRGFPAQTPFLPSEKPDANMVIWTLSREPQTNGRGIGLKND